MNTFLEERVETSAVVSVLICPSWLPMNTFLEERVEGLGRPFGRPRSPES